MADKRIDIVVTSKVKDALSGLASVTKSVARIGAIGGGIVATGLTAASVAAIKAAASYETLKLRLEAVTGSAQKAETIFKDIREFAASTPLQLDDLVEARILLEGVGVSGTKALRKAAGAAAALNKPLIEVASAVASLETEPLRRMGIEVRRVGEQATFQFRDKMGRSITRVTNGIDEARQALLGIFSVKFGGFLGKASQTFNGLVSTLRDKLKDVAAQFGEGLLPAAKRFVGEMNTRLQALFDSGKIESWGKRIGDTINAAFSPEGRMAIIDYIRDTFNAITGRLGETLSRAGEDIGREIKASVLEAISRIQPGAVGRESREAAAILRQPVPRVNLNAMYPFPEFPIKPQQTQMDLPVNASIFRHRGYINGQNLGFERAGSGVFRESFFGAGSARLSNDGKTLITAGDVTVKDAINMMHETLKGMSNKFQPIAVAQ